MGYGNTEIMRGRKVAQDTKKKEDRKLKEKRWTRREVVVSNRSIDR